MSNSQALKIAVIYGSVRTARQGIKAARFIINKVEQRGHEALRTILAELGTPSIPSAFPISQIHAAFDNDGNALDEAYEKRVVKFLDEFEWYTQALKRARDAGACSKAVPVQQQMCRGKSRLK